MGYSYFNGSRWIGGTAALLHKVKEDGGLNNHYFKVYNAINEVIEKENEKELKKAIRNSDKLFKFGA